MTRLFLCLAPPFLILAAEKGKGLMNKAEGKEKDETGNRKPERKGKCSILNIQ
jgi:hypothetical protein